MLKNKEHPNIYIYFDRKKNCNQEIWAHSKCAVLVLEIIFIFQRTKNLYLSHNIQHGKPY